MKKRVLFYASVAVILFLFVGYFLSDSYYFKQLIQKNHLTTPGEAFTFITRETKPINWEKNANIQQGLTPRYLLSVRKYLWCDEGAILLLTFARQMGYKTRLVDLLDSAGVSHHTVAQVLENGKWVAYDYTYHHTGEINCSHEIGYKPRLVYRQYPNTYNFVLQYNYFVQKAILFVRNVQEPNPPVFKQL